MLPVCHHYNAKNKFSEPLSSIILNTQRVSYAFNYALLKCATAQKLERFVSSVRKSKIAESLFQLKKLTSTCFSVKGAT